MLARKILRTIESGKEKAYFGGKEVLGVYFKRFFQRIFLRYCGMRRCGEGRVV